MKRSHFLVELKMFRNKRGLSRLISMMIPLFCIVFVSRHMVLGEGRRNTLRRASQVLATEKEMIKWNEQYHIGICNTASQLIKTSVLKEKVSNFSCASVICLNSVRHHQHIDLSTAAFSEIRRDDCPKASGGQVTPSKDQQTQVSFIVSIHNKDYMAAQAILELFRTADEAESAEFIVVDDGSLTELFQVTYALRRMKYLFGTRIVFIRNANRLGFVASNMKAASTARGNYLAFVNSDTYVLRGWLAALLATFKQFPDAGLVGPLFIEDKGIINEAGGIIFSDASANKHGGGNKFSHLYTYARSVDYISGAAILVKRSAFQQVGGFKSVYRLGYYEDTDLAMSLRKSGYLIIYQPHSIVYHKHGSTFGKQMETLMNKNRVIFANIWSAELNRTHCFRTTQLWVAARRLMSPRLLWIDHRVPAYDYDSGSVRLLEILKILVAYNYHIVFQAQYSFDANMRHRYIAVLEFMGIEVLPTCEANNAFCSDYWKKLKICPFDVIIISRSEIYSIWIGTVKRLCPKITVVYDTVDLSFIRIMRQQKLAQEKSVLLPEYFLLANKSSIEEKELKPINEAHSVIVVSQLELDVLRNRGVPGNKLTVIPNIHRVVAPSDVINSCSKRNGILFVGHICHFPNQQAIVFLIKEILPHLIENWPFDDDSNPAIHIAGSCAPPKYLLELMKKKKEYVHFHGWLSEDALQQLYGQVKVAVAPLQIGAGVKGKETVH